VNYKIIRGGLALATVAAASYFAWRAARPAMPRLIDQVDNQDYSRDSAPIVVAGVIADDTLVLRPIPMPSDPTHPLQLRRLTLQVENVLKGGPLPVRIEVYYFTWAGGFDGPQPLGMWAAGGRRVLWLRKDSGVFRTSCDGWDYRTTSVDSGSHLHYRPDSQKPIAYALADLILTRGDGVVNEAHFAAGIERGVPMKDCKTT
jgi:hypothetical protein